eukprot:1616741-Rhodomonas_salina.2
MEKHPLFRNQMQHSSKSWERPFFVSVGLGAYESTSVLNVAKRSRSTIPEGFVPAMRGTL